MSSDGGNFPKVRCLRSSIFNQPSTENPTLDAGEYFEEYKKLLPTIDVVRGRPVFENATLENNFYSEVLDISHEQVEELKAVTSIANLNCPGEIQPIDFKLHESDADFHMKYEMSRSSTSEEHNLVSVKKRLETEGDLYPHYTFKYGNYVWIGSEELPNVRNDLNPFDFSNIVFCIKVYHPYLSFTGYHHRVKLLQEIHILGNQFLSDLKDNILCSMDFAGITDESENPSLKQYATEVEHRGNYLSSFIFIENQFFNDTRSSSMRDLSSVIIDWAKSKNIGNFTKESMENKMMKDLKFKIGQPYVYQHQGDCEHVLIISDVRFLTIDDPLTSHNYPSLYAKGRCSGRYCMMCGISYARWLVTGNSRLTHDKNYFCNRCFISYNYIDGRKIGNFKAYKYIDPIALL